MTDQIKPLELFETDHKAAVKEVIRRKHALDSHDFDDTEFCTKCGQAHEHVLDHWVECFGGDKIVPVSHLIAARRLASLVRIVDRGPGRFDVYIDEPDGAA